MAFCSKLTFAEHHPTIVSKAKYETAIPNSAECFVSYEKIKKCFFSHEKIQLYKLYVIFPPKHFLTRRLYKL